MYVIPKGKDIIITADMIAQIKDSLTKADKEYLEVVYASCYIILLIFLDNPYMKWTF